MQLPANTTPSSQYTRYRSLANDRGTHKQQQPQDMTCRYSRPSSQHRTTLKANKTTTAMAKKKTQWSQDEAAGTQIALSQPVPSACCPATKQQGGTRHSKPMCISRCGAWYHCVHAQTHVLIIRSKAQASCWALSKGLKHDISAVIPVLVSVTLASHARCESSMPTYHACGILRGLGSCLRLTPIA